MRPRSNLVLILYGGKSLLPMQPSPGQKPSLSRVSAFRASARTTTSGHWVVPRPDRWIFTATSPFPGINDSHTHPGYAAAIGATVTLHDGNWIQGADPKQTLDALATLAQETPKGKWLRGRNRSLPAPRFEGT